MTKYIKEKSRLVREEARRRHEEAKRQQETEKASVIWEAKDQGGYACSFSRIPMLSLWEFSVDEGNFSGYPYTHISRDDLIKLRDAINEELNNSSPYTDFEGKSHG